MEIFHREVKHSRRGTKRLKQIWEKRVVTKVVEMYLGGRDSSKREFYLNGVKIPPQQEFKDEFPCSPPTPPVKKYVQSFSIHLFWLFYIINYRTVLTDSARFTILVR